MMCATISQLGKALTVVRYVYPPFAFLYFGVASLASVFTSQTVHIVFLDQRVKRKFFWLMHLATLGYVLQAFLLALQSLQKGLTAGQDEIIYLAFSAIVWAVHGLALRDSNSLACYPYCVNWTTAIFVELFLLITPALFFAPLKPVEFTVFALRILQICNFVALLDLYLSIRSTPGPAGHLGHPSDPENVQPAGVEELKHSCPDPPVTKATLSELEVLKIVFNPQLRHDVNFDLDLYFRPNLDGKNGQIKIQKTTEFWDLLTVQLDAFMHDPVSFVKGFSEREWCLPRIFRTISEILSPLVRPETTPSVEEILNVELQQLRKGVVDFEKLASWLSSTLKSHCAPMRDDSVDEMSKYLSTGYNTRDIAVIVQGLQRLFDVIETMKLDVANHQIRCLRPSLIRDTVEFEQTFFLKKIASRKIDVCAAKSWFRAAKLSSLEAQVRPSNLSGDSWAFFYGFASLLLPSKSSTKVPDTYMFDEERIMKLRSDMLDAVNLDICIRLLRRKLDEQRDSTRRTSSPCWDVVSASGNPGPWASHNITASTQSRRTLVNVNEKTVPESRYLPIRNLPKRPITRINPVLEDEESDAGSPGTSRTSSSSSTTSKPPAFPLSRSIVESSIHGDENFGQSILDIINNVPGSNRWQQSCMAIALELARSSNLNFLPNFESQLKDCISNPRSPVFLASEVNVLAELTPLLSGFAERYMALTSTQLFEATSLPNPVPDQLPKRKAALVSIAKRSAHIVALQMLIWNPILHFIKLDTDTSR